MRISDWSSDVCSSDLGGRDHGSPARHARVAGLARAGESADTDYRRSGAMTEADRPDIDAALAALLAPPARAGEERKRVVEGKSVSDRVDLGGRRVLKQQKHLRTDK